MSRNSSDGHGTGQIEVVLCTYNGGRYIDEQLGSILGQSRAVDCVSVYDDGSSDDTLNRLQQWVDAGAPVRIARNTANLGYAENFGQGLARANGDFVFFSDQDDVWEPNKVARMMQAFSDPRCVLVFSDGQPIDSEGVTIECPTVLRGYGLGSAQLANFHSQGWALLLARNYINGAAMAVRRGVAQQALPIPARFPHDYWIALWLARAGGAACIDEPLYRYRLHQSNTLGRRDAALHHQLLSVWRNPAPPRQLDLARMRALLERMPADDGRRPEVARKLAWLVRVAEEPRRGRRLAHITAAWLRGEYGRYRAPFGLLRDLIAAVR